MFFHWQRLYTWDDDVDAMRVHSRDVGRRSSVWWALSTLWKSHSSERCYIKQHKQNHLNIGGCCCCCSSNDLTLEKWSLETGNFIKKRHYTFTHKTTNKKKQFPVSDGEKNVDNDIGDWRSASQRVIIICTKTGRRNYSREKNLGYGQWHKWREWRAHRITIFLSFFSLF